jgi:hypothetical protein
VKHEVLDNLNKIIVDIEFYKSKKDLIRFIIRVNNILDDDKSDTIVGIFNEITNKINKENLTEKQLETLQKVLYGFLLRNQKSYIQKTLAEGNTIYEYKNSYSVYINNNETDVKDMIARTFGNKKILSINIDGSK